MTFLFEKPEPLIVAGVNWPVLEYLIERFNRTALEGYIILRRNSLKDLELCLSADCNNQMLALLSEPFADALLTESEKREQLIRVVSRFLLRAKHEHAAIVTPPISTSASSLSDLTSGGISSPMERLGVPDSVTTAESEISGNPAG